MKCLVIEVDGTVEVKEFDPDSLGDKSCFYFNGICDAFADKYTNTENKLASEICSKFTESNDIVNGSLIICGYPDKNDKHTDIPQCIVEEIMAYLSPDTNKDELLICNHSSIICGKCLECGIDIV